MDVMLWSIRSLFGCCIRTITASESSFSTFTWYVIFTDASKTSLKMVQTYGGTNWGNLGYHGGDTSYDYGAAITEDRQVYREKFSEEKLEAEFFKVSPAYLTALPGNSSNGSYVSTSSLTTTRLSGTDYKTNFYVVRHANWTSTDTTTYKWIVPTSNGNVSVPQLGGSLTLSSRDSKLHVTDYDVGGSNLLYSSGEIYSWQKSRSGKSVLILYGGADETHEFAFESSAGRPTLAEGSGVKIERIGSSWVVRWNVTPARKVVNFERSNLEVHLLWRNDAYNHWVVELPAESPIGKYSSPSKSSVIVKGGYLVRDASIHGGELHLTGDINATTDFELLFEPTGKVQSITFNGHQITSRHSKHGRLAGTVSFKAPKISVPDLSEAEWKYLDSLPEVQSTYDDSKWTVCDHKETTNPQKPLTPTSLYASDYGFHTGSLIYRGHFTANGEESNVYLNVSGGVGFAHSVWLDSTFLGSYAGNGSIQFQNQTLDLPSTLQNGTRHTITLLIDHMGQDEEAPGTDAIKAPRGLVNFDLAGHPKSDVVWKLSGNLGGEQYIDLARGPRNEGAMYAERQGYHLPKPPSQKWKAASPVDGISGAGVGFFSTSFELHVPKGYDVPMSFVFPEPTLEASGAFRCQLFVNGYQFGKYGKSSVCHGLARTLISD